MKENSSYGQTILNELIKNIVISKKSSHAYIIENNSGSNEAVLELAKAIICPNDFLAKDNCSNCNICNKVNNNNYLELKIINPDGMFIKKEQLSELQEEFSTIAIENFKRVYIINEAERMRKETANSMLKFLEEPNNNIVAILTTKNVEKILPTIISRCQVIRLQKNISKMKISDLLNKTYDKEEEKNEIISCIINFFEAIEIMNNDIIIEKNELFCKKYSKKDDYIELINIAINFYYDVIRYNKKIDLLYFKEYDTIINKINEKNDINKLIDKINFLIEAKKSIQNNPNLNLLSNKLIFELGK